LISALWERSVPLITERLAILDRASQAALHDGLTPGLRDDASDTAHKLAGSLGMFGYPRGTEIARELELLLEADDAVDPVTLRQLVTALRASLPL
jgi:HPt (histidine-containing phosphotransfer) domain-containing protein